MIALDTLFPAYVRTVCVEIDAATRFPLPPEEEAAVADAVEKRVREFAAGRHCAHSALDALGVPRAPLLKSERGDPRWPEGVVGSISHSARACAAAAARRAHTPGVGLDIEDTSRMTADIATRILAPAEIEWIDRQPPEDIAFWRTVFFSAKESVYKCLFPFVQGWIGFDEVTVHPDGANAFSVTLGDKPLAAMPPGHRLEGRMVCASPLVVTGVHLRAEDHSSPISPL